MSAPLEEDTSEDGDINIFSSLSRAPAGRQNEGEGDESFFAFSPLLPASLVEANERVR